MIKECRVIINNDMYTIVHFDNIEIQFPPIGKDVDKVFVKHENDSYIIVDENEKNGINDIQKKKISKKKTIIKNSEVEESGDFSA